MKPTPGTSGSGVSSFAGLSTDTPDRVNIELADNRFEPGVELPIRISVYDSTYNPVSFADVTGSITDPYGGIHAIQFYPDLSGEGEYLSTFVLDEPGVYAMEVTAEQDGAVIGTQRRSVLSYPSKKEFQDAVLKKSYLENIARLNGGIYYEPSEASAIPGNLKARRTGTSIFHYEYIWDTPLLFLLVVIILSIEWIYRRNKGLP